MMMIIIIYISNLHIPVSLLRNLTATKKATPTGRQASSRLPSLQSSAGSCSKRGGATNKNFSSFRTGRAGPRVLVNLVVTGFYAKAHGGPTYGTPETGPGFLAVDWVTMWAVAPADSFHSIWGISAATGFRKEEEDELLATSIVSAMSTIHE